MTKMPILDRGDRDGPVGFEPSLGRPARRGSWDDLAEGTFRRAGAALSEGDWHAAADLVEVSVLEADELRDIYGRWPAEIERWILDRGAARSALDRLTTDLGDVLGGVEFIGDVMHDGWPRYVTAVEQASASCRISDPGSAAAIEHARLVWLEVHDAAVDAVSGMIDIAVRLIGEDALGDLWDHLMVSWYDVHAQRYTLENQDWSESARQLAIAVFDGFHAHLAGADRSGEIVLIEERDRIGFRFAPCGSGGRAVSSGITDGKPRSGAPFDFAVTTEPHDWAWNTVGICSYCVHCCQLNERMPIDRIGYPTRVIDAPTWPTTETEPACTWWIYKHPSLVPDEVYHRVGRSPDRRPQSPGGSA